MNGIQTPPAPPDMMNTALKFMQLKTLMGQNRNAASLQGKKFEEDKRATQREEQLEANSFTLNLLTGVKSQQDLDVAKRILKSRYPKGAENIDKSIPSTYDANTIRIITNALRDHASRLGNEKLAWEKSKPMGISAGSEVWKGGKKVSSVPFAPPKKNFDIFEDDEGNQFYVEKGKPIPEGYGKVQAKGTSFNINTGNLGKTTKTGLEKDIIEGVKNLQSFQETGKLFKKEYLQFTGKGRKLVAETMDKAGIATSGQKEFSREYATWFRRAKADFIAFRKWATGVAGGEKEMAEIATSFPDPVKNSPTQYQANLDSIEETTKQVLMLNVDFLRSGIDVDQPLDKVLEQAAAAGIPVPPEVLKPIVIRFDEKGNMLP